jgi:hypothetical protein
LVDSGRSVRRRSGRACGLFACRRAVIGLPTSHPSVEYPQIEHCKESLWGSKRIITK